MRFLILSKTEAYDTKTNLFWRRDFVKSITWHEALVYAANLGSSWRVPTYHELVSIVDISQINPTIDVKVFPNTPFEWFWSSSDYAMESSYAWRVNFGYGRVNFSDKDRHRFLRCVRNEQAPLSSGGLR